MENWHYTENQIDSVTKNNRKLMQAIVRDHFGKLTGTATKDARYQPLLAQLTPVKTAWDAAYGNWKLAQASYGSATLTLSNLFDVLQTKPVGEGRSKIDEWESKAKSYWAAGSSVYEYLFPRGREPFTTGTIEGKVGELPLFVTRLQKKAADLTTLAAAAGLAQEKKDEYTEQAAALTKIATSVTAFSTQVSAAYDTQNGLEGEVSRLSKLVETARVEVADMIYKNIADAMSLNYRAKDRPQVAALFDLSLIMNPPAADDATPDPSVPAVPVIPPVS